VAHQTGDDELHVGATLGQDDATSAAMYAQRSPAAKSDLRTSRNSIEQHEATIKISLRKWAHLDRRKYLPMAGQKVLPDVSKKR
jgi:hypothetical protein